ncbi:MAG: hypothetical protein N2380_03050 [bacterium]|nr:hypothetical protein [bacterium]
METVTQRVDRLEEAMRALAEQSKITQEEIARLSNEMRDFKDEMRGFKDEMRSFKNEMNKRWGELANKMGTLVEDIFAPSLDLAIEKYFKVKLKDIIQRRIIRKGDREIEIDLLAYSDYYAFIVEVKSSPDRLGYVDDFIEKLKELPEILQELKKYRIIPIYAGLSLKENTVKYLTKNNIYAMMVRGDILEIVNFEDINMDN